MLRDCFKYRRLVAFPYDIFQKHAQPNDEGPGITWAFESDSVPLGGGGKI